MPQSDTPQRPHAVVQTAVAGAAPIDDPQALEFERYRRYLMVLAASHVLDPASRDRLDLSGVVQQTFLEAHQKRGEFRGTCPAEMAGWLRSILAHNLADALRGAGREKRDVNRQRSLDQALEQSSVRLATALAATDQSSPSQAAHREDRAVLLADALAELPEAQREAVVLRHWHGRTLAETAAHMNRTPASVVGLLQRGLKALRLRMQQHRQRGDL